MTFDFLKSTVRRNRMTGIAAIKTVISLIMPLAFRPSRAALESVTRGTLSLPSSGGWEHSRWLDLSCGLLHAMPYGDDRAARRAGTTRHGQFVAGNCIIALLHTSQPIRERGAIHLHRVRAVGFIDLVCAEIHDASQHNRLVFVGRSAGPIAGGELRHVGSRDNEDVITVRLENHDALGAGTEGFDLAAIRTRGRVRGHGPGANKLLFGRLSGCVFRHDRKTRHRCQGHAEHMSAIHDASPSEGTSRGWKSNRPRHRDPSGHFAKPP